MARQVIVEGVNSIPPPLNAHNAHQRARISRSIVTARSSVNVAYNDTLVVVTYRVLCKSSANSLVQFIVFQMIWVFCDNRLLSRCIFPGFSNVIMNDLYCLNLVIINTCRHDI